jgi:uncharacterized RDD family membrane protein YckC
VTGVEDRVTHFLEGTRRNRREITTPEGVPLEVEIATFPERATAFVLDLAIWFGATIILLLSLFLLLGPLLGLLRFAGAGALFVGLLLFFAFIIRNFYFLHFELVWRGTTPGKRIVGLRVIDRGGGPLLPAAVVARNLTREIEAFVPLSLLLSLNSGAAGGWERLCLGLWLMLFAALPLFNRDRMRAGDLIAGTLVIAMPQRSLLADLVDERARFAFSESQLRAYGAFELQILEELLRRPDGPETRQLRREVCEKISRKIAWSAAVPDGEVERFLRDFYVAERAWLEREQLFGKIHADKHEREKAAG